MSGRFWRHIETLRFSVIHDRRAARPTRNTPEVTLECGRNRMQAWRDWKVTLECGRNSRASDAGMEIGLEGAMCALEMLDGGRSVFTCLSFPTCMSLDSVVFILST